MINSVDIKGLRGIREGRLDNLTPLVVLTGRNGSGKSAILDALLIASSPKPSEALLQAAAHPQEVSGAPLWLLWKAGDAGATKVTVWTDKETALSQKN